MQRLSEIVDEIIQSPRFKQLDNLIENNSYHEHESVYAHSLSVYKRALEAVQGDFISNTEAKKLYLSFLNEELYGYKRSELLCLIALLHDIGKGEAGVLVTDEDGNTKAPGHELAGSTIVDQFIDQQDFSPEAIKYLTNCIRLHNTMGNYFDKPVPGDILQIVNEIKQEGEGYFIENLFNIYCDALEADVFADSLLKIVQVFNQPELYD
ncbi:hypothetical protein A2631_00575 [Candidatus Daviesbacteria bacterium RIFCSPHIGHO2_01_FULL_44_29]|uniref:HD/PDEase domain-containing protein n=1 Tax=Candidatus Daviesbacteria bacterium RIFCSPHIGHO2_02_FULL_43_12 TaxID=1797776 RepID=A0A1F5KHP9_9BACT|nr:MAG: hypothetical protein A2631_00575 [Candidatus Daviesbacteria bacterium RIFCSPHIGHO2_01_FULL_44_29]OGE39441.1 MAG: hypothetical protein A3E86_01485 [Candidatus Daviesbacteria bacterium RIFCSPHIGHO2_12_FULL_47_45]OGE40340.1 MAG: hypothetical protein A3D25_03085 [Candidatus Daviesbacteria bacterium RIFCSPHIGHO2_02_FULL_43_12]OGE69741.1 MAG: hypothetical protein A3B55_02120 [Candidatus Daviesbacteria bacterium RIFCSPLOWO2_01_FULL_43_15]